MAKDIERGPAGSIRPRHTLGAIAVGVVAVLVAFWALSAVVGVVWFVVKVAVVVAVVAGVLRLMGRRRR